MNGKLEIKSEIKEDKNDTDWLSRDCYGCMYGVTFKKQKIWLA